MNDPDDPFDEGILQPSIVKQFRNILDQYQDNGQILKELIQNAEDAGASTIKFLIDHSQYDTQPDKLLFPSLANLQGPALCAYNDATFTDEDWKGIRMIQDSVKADDPLKVGRFGLGFKSVFHMTDLPGVLSNNKVAFIDPQAVYLRRNKTIPQTGETVEVPTTSRALRLRADLMAKYPSQLEPFMHDIFDLSASTIKCGGSYQGTVFRFPLRNTERSDISSTLYTVQRLKQLCQQLEEESHFLLLFLKHVHTIEVYEKKAAGMAPTLVQSIKVSNQNREEVVLAKRRSFHSSIKARPFEKHSCSYPLTTTYWSHSCDATSRQWLVTQHYAGNTDSHATENAQLLPLIGVALPLSDLGSHLCRGHTFCFLPLPQNDDNLTGLKVHVNGYFAVDQSRTHLKWRDHSWQRDDADADWNHWLINNVLPVALWELVRFAIDLHKQGRVEVSDVYNIMANSLEIKKNWEPLLDAFWKRLDQYDCLHTNQLATWGNPKQCYIVPHGDRKYFSVLEKICDDAKLALVDPPGHVLNEVENRHLGIYVTRELVHKVLSKNMKLLENERWTILQYLVSEDRMDLIIGLKLMKLEDGTWIQFTPSSSSVVYLETVECRKSLLPLFTSKTFMAACSVEDSGYSIMKKIANTGKTQVTILNNSNFPTVLRKAFQGLTSYQCDQKPLNVGFSWLVTLWRHIEKHPSQVHLFEGLPIVPESNKKWSVLVKNVPYVASTLEDDSLSDLPVSVEILKSLGIRVVKSFEEAFARIPRKLLKEFIAQPTAVGILDAFQKLDRKQLIKKVESLDCQGKKNLLKLITGATPLYGHHTTLLQDLPLLLCYRTSKNGTEQWKKMSEVAYATEMDLPVFVTKAIAKSKVCGQYARTIGVSELTATEVLVKIIFPDLMNKHLKRIYTDGDVEKLMIMVMDNFDVHQRNNPRFAHCIREIPFVQSGSGLSPPSKLLDPTEEKTKKMFQGLPVFPMGLFAQHKCSAKLSEHNCFQEIDDEKLLLLARHIDQNHCSGSLLENGQQLQTFICENVHSISRHTFLMLRSLQWIPVQQEGPKHYPASIPWFGKSIFFSSPDKTMAWVPVKSQGPKNSATTTEQYQYVVGSVKPVAKVLLDTDTAQRLQCNQEPMVEEVLEHLQNVVQNYGEGDIPPVRMLKYIYGYIWENQDIDDEDIDEEIASLADESFKWIWGGTCFTDIRHIVLSECLVALEPYAYRLPHDLSEFTDMFQKLGAKPGAQLDAVLVDIKNFHENNCPDRPKMPRVRHDLQMCLQILDIMEREGSLKENTENHVPIPVEWDKDVLKLVDCNQCTYCEDDSINIKDIQEELHIVHRDIPRRVVKALGVPNMMSRYLNAEELDFMSYGQGEPLTRRIASLLEDYKDGFAVLKELIQNADDAEASEVHFIYDKRDFGKVSKSLISPEIRQVLGPALLCYNDRVFTDDDFANIVKLSGATKKEKVDKVGRFGLGFNVVYNLTDVPSFISRDTIAYFDPHMKYLRQAIKDPSKPGIKLNVKHHGNQIRKFRDQFQVFHGILGCDMQSNPLPLFDGTLFRFPLRTASQAEESEISTNYYSEREVRDLFSLLQKTSEYLLLFTQNVSCVKVSEIHMDCDLVLCAEITKTPVQLLRSMEFGDFSNVPLRHKPEEEYKVLKHASVRDGQAGTDHSNVIVEVRATFHKSLVFAEAESKAKCKFWNVISVIGSKDAILEKDSIPVGAVAVSLKREGDARFAPEVLDPKHRGFMFCFLPLPIHNQLPVHVNGYFAVTPSRRQLCTQEYDDKRDPKAKWNEFLMQGVIREAYTRAFVDMTKRPDVYDPIDLQNAMVHFFPTDIQEDIDGIGNLLYLFCNSFYKSVTNDQAVRLFHDRNKWTSFKVMRFLDSCLLDLPVGKLMVDVCRIYFQQKLDQDFVEIPQSVIRQIETSGFTKELCEHKITLVMFYRDIFLPIIDKVKQDIRDSLVCFALLHGNEELCQIIQNVSCIPVTCSDSLMKPCQLVDPDGPLKDLYSNNDGPFPKWLEEPNRPQKVEIQLALKALGMRVDNITCEETLERALTISKLKDGTKRARSLVTLVSVKMEMETNTNDFQELVKKLHRVPFLPVAVKPNDWNLPWKDNEKYISPDESYSEEQKELVGCSEVVASFPGMKDEKLMKVLNYVNKEVTEEHITYQISCVVEAQSRNKGKDFRTSFELHHKKIMHAIYKFLDKKASSNGGINFETYKTSDFIMVTGGGIVSPGMCALNCPVDLYPYLFKLSWDFQREYKDLIKSLDIVPHFDAGAMVSLLKRLHDDIGTLAKADVFKVACNAAIHLSDLQDQDKASFQKELYLPDFNKVMTSAQALCFNNCPWIAVQDKKILHTAISYDVASKLGVKSIREETIHSFQHGIPFGQSEKLANRIKRILEGYPCDKEILQELLQNADDAEADVVHFFLDHRKHPNERVFEGWKSVEGPALLVYNNKPFTAKDIEGIKNLGEGSKGLDPVTTGKYGVGFNCVYHISDTPMFLTPDFEEEDNHVLVAFDPNCKYIPGSTPLQPGQKYTNARDLRKIFPDVFSCFEVPEKNFSRGTLFRFPLRTYTMASQSEISNKAITPGDIHKLFETFSLNLEQCLLFLQNVKEITLNEIHANNKVTTVDRVLSKPTQKNNGLTYNLRQYVKEVGTIGLSSDQSYKHHYELDIRKHGRQDDAKWLVLQQIGVRNPSNVKTELVRKYHEKNAVILPKGGVAIQLNKEKETDTQEGRLFCLLPLPVCTQLAMHINGSFMLDHESRRNLWQTDNKTGFRFMWNEMILKEIVADLYVDAMEVVAHWFPRLKQPFGNVEAVITYFSGIFPRSTTNDPYLFILHEAIYCKMAQRMPAVIPVIRYKNTWRQPLDYPTNDLVDLDWFPVGGPNGKVAYFDEIEAQLLGTTRPSLLRAYSSVEDRLKQKEYEQKQVIRLRKALANSGFPVTQVNLLVKEMFVKYTSKVAEVHSLSPPAVLKHFLGQSWEQYDMKVPRNIRDTPFCDATTLCQVLTYCKGDLSKYLDGLPMLLMADDSVQKFNSQMTVLVSEYHELVPAKQDMFASKSFLSFLEIENIKRFLKPMTCQDLSTIIHFRLDKGKYQGTDKMVPMDTGDKTFALWVRRLWEFIGTEVVSLKEGKYFIDKSGLESLQSWCIFPMKRGSVYLVPPLKYFNIVLDLRQHENNPTLKTIFQKMDFPEPFLPSENCSGLLRVIQECVATFEKADRVVTCMSKAMEEFPLHIDGLDSYYRGRLLDYFSDHVIDLEKIPETAAATLCKLPIFQSVFGVLVKLDAQEGKNLFSVSEDIPKKGMETWCTETHTLYLKSQKKYAELYRLLNIKELTFVEAYVKHILCQFAVFNASERFLHLQKIKRFVEDTCEREHKPLLRKLLEVPFMANRNGELERTAEFYDLEVPLFREMEENFPTEEFQRFEWISFLRKIGLKYKPEAHHMVKYAKKIAQLSKPDDQKAARLKCKLLLQTLFANNELFQDACRQIKSIHFIPQGLPKPQFVELCEVYKTKAFPFVCFQESVTHNYADLVWSKVAVLPAFAAPPTKAQKEELSVFIKPSLDMVLENLQQVCEKYPTLRNPELRECIQEFLSSTYVFVMKNHLDDDLHKMSAIPCVAVDNGARLVMPPQVAVGLSTEIPPYLYSLPLHIGPYEKLLKKIGITKSVTLEQYADVLIQIYNHSKGDTLHPNELGASVSAFCGFLMLSKSLQNLTGELKGKTLYCLTERKTLSRASDVIFIDSVDLKFRVKSLNLPCMRDLGPVISNCEISQVLKKLPDSQKPRYVSAVIVEKFDSGVSDREKTNRCLELEGKLSSHEFHTGILRLIRHENQTKEAANHESDEHEQILVRKLTDVKFFEVATLMTYLVYNGERLTKSERQVSLFLDKAEKSTIYMCANPKEWENPPAMLHTLICSVISEIMEHKTRTVEKYIIELLQINDNKMQAVLDEHRIRPYDAPGVANTAESVMQTSGDYIPVEIHHLLQPCIVHLRVDEYVGYEEHDPYEDEEPLPGDGSGNAEELASVYILAKVVAILAPEGACSYLNYSYRISIGNGEFKEVHATSLYRFSRDRETDQASTTTSQALVLLPAADSDDTDTHDHQASGNDTSSRHGRPYRGNTDDHGSRPSPTSDDSSSDHVFEMSDIIAIKAEIRKILLEAWKMEEAHRKKVVKRLWLQWHPDKNPGRTDLATKMFQFIQWAIDRMEKQQPLEEEETDNSSGYNFHQRRTNHDFWDHFNFSGFSHRARSHGQRQRSRTYDHFWEGSRPSWSQMKNPQPTEAKRWMKQANYDLVSVANDVTGHAVSHEWACLKSYHAAEKALKATQFAVDADQISSAQHSLTLLCHQVPQCTTTAQRLRRCVGDPEKICYPTSGIPHNNFTAREAIEARELARTIVDTCQIFLDSKL